MDFAGFKDLKDLEGEVAIVTGAANGIGEMTARWLAKYGIYVVCADKNPLVNDVAADIGPLARPFVCDVANDGDRFALSWKPQEFFCKTARIGIVAAGIAINGRSVERQENGGVKLFPEASYDRLMDINCKGLYYCTLHMVGRLLEAGLTRKPLHGHDWSGVFVGMGSIVDKGHFGQAVYAAAKAAIAAFYASLNMEHNQQHGIRFTDFCPGYTDTKMVMEGMTEKARLRAIGEVISHEIHSVESVVEGILAELVAWADPAYAGREIRPDDFELTGKYTIVRKYAPAA